MNIRSICEAEKFDHKELAADDPRGRVRGVGAPNDVNGWMCFRMIYPQRIPLGLSNTTSSFRNKMGVG